MLPYAAVINCERKGTAREPSIPNNNDHNKIIISGAIPAVQRASPTLSVWGTWVTLSPILGQRG